MLNESQLYCGWTAGVCWKKYLRSPNSSTKIQKIIRRISDSPSQEQKYKKQNKNQNYWNNHEEIKNTHFFKLILVAKSFRVFNVLIKSTRVLCITRYFLDCIQRIQSIAL